MAVAAVPQGGAGPQGGAALQEGPVLQEEAAPQMGAGPQGETDPREGTAPQGRTDPRVGAGREQGSPWGVAPNQAAATSHRRSACPPSPRTCASCHPGTAVLPIADVKHVLQAPARVQEAYSLPGTANMPIADEAGILR